jgi:hypothetical protein
VFTDNFIAFIRKGSFYVLNLPYNIPTNAYFVFDPDTPSAIKIISMEVDGHNISPLFYPAGPISEPRTYANVIKADKSFQGNYLSMYWSINQGNDFLFWTDGQFNSYRIARSMRVLKIKYKILIPKKYTPFFDIEVEQKNDMIYFSCEYTVTVDVPKS